MPGSRFPVLILCLLAAAVTVRAQVVAPYEIPDTDLRSLQTQNMKDLLQIGESIKQNRFDFPFYFSRKLDLDEQVQKRSDQHSIRFERFNNQVVLAITGNYYAAYSEEKVSEGERARDSFLNAIVPILKLTVPHFQHNSAFQGYAIEISHHVRTKVIGMPMEKPENMLVYLPQSAAIKLVEAKTSGGLQAALLDAQVYVNAEPLALWLDESLPQPVMALAPAPKRQSTDTVMDRAYTQLLGTATPPPAADSAPRPGLPDLTPAPNQPARDLSPEALTALQTASQPLLTSITKELDPQAHFVAYAPPSFIAFRKGIYLELSMNTALPESARGSQYKLAALAFDQHISHLIRPAMGYMKGAEAYDGIGFSTTVHLPGSGADSPEAVEFFFPFKALRCFESYDCTGQQLIDSGAVLINGERAGLDLQKAEAEKP